MVAEKRSSNWKNVEGYVGYSHRAAYLFSVGDKLFDETYVPTQKDFTEEQWAAFEEEVREKNENNQDWETSITDVIPFRYRGGKTIQTLDEAKQAAINFANYVS